MHMEGLSLRRRACVLCGEPIVERGRIDRMYCSSSCRTLAWKARKQASAEGAVIAGIIAWIFGGSIIASAIGTTIGNPLTYPLIWFSSYEAGTLFVDHDKHIASIDLSPLHDSYGQILSDPIGFAQTFWHVLEPVIVPLSIGSTILGILAAALCYFAVRPLVRTYRERRLIRIAKAAALNRGAVS